MEKYFKQIIVIELLCIAYGVIHNFLYMSQVFMYIAAFGAIASSLALFWICFKSTTISNKNKKVGLAVASIPFVFLFIGLVFLIILSRNTHG
jgi:hypothetical protein